MFRPSSRPPRALVRSRFLLIVGVALALLGGGCGGATYTTSGEAQTLASASYQVGQHVQVEWRGSWYAATIVAVLDGGQYHIHYDGWGDEWDEAVDALRIRTEGEVIAPPTDLIEPETYVDESGQTTENTGTTEDPGGYTPPPEQGLQAGLRVHVEWRGSWYLAEVVDAPYGSPGIRVHYVGWDAEWDEDVPRERVRVDGTTQ